MSTTHPGATDIEEDEHDQYIDPDDVYLEVDQDEGDYPMDEDDDNDEADGDTIAAGSSANMHHEDTSKLHFPSHSNSVFAVATHPIASIAASGGEDDLGYIWDYTNGDEVVKLTGHTDSVCSVGFSHDGEMLATGGMDGKVRIWKRVGTDGFRNWTFLTELQGPDEVTWLRWHPKGYVLLAGSNDTMVWLWNLPSGDTMQVFAGHNGPVQCGQFTPDGKRIITADADGALIFWDPRSPDPVFKLTPDDTRFNLDGITSLAVNPSSTLAVVGGASGGVRVVSLSKGEIVGALGGHKEGESIEAIAFVGFAGASEVVVTGGTDGKAHVWDLTTMRVRAILEHEDPITTLLPLPSPKTHMLVSCSADSMLRTWDTRTGTLLREHRGHHGPVLGAALAPSGDVVVSAGDDGVCLVFQTE